MNAVETVFSVGPITALVSTLTVAWPLMNSRTINTTISIVININIVSNHKESFEKIFKM